MISFVSSVPYLRAYDDLLTTLGIAQRPFGGTPYQAPPAPSSPTPSIVELTPQAAQPSHYRVPSRSLHFILRLTFPVNLLLGIASWTNLVGGLTLIHEYVGIVFVVALFWIGVELALRGGGIGTTAAMFVVGIALTIVGLTQEGIGSWLFQLIHLSLAVLANGLSEMAYARMIRLAYVVRA